MRQVLAADIGGTNIRLALVSEDGCIIDETRCTAELSRHNLQSQQNAEVHILNALCEVIQPFADMHAVTSLGMGFPGFFHSQSGLLASSPNLPLLRDFALAERLAEQLSIDVAVENDALCAAIGEHRYGAGKGYANLLHVTLGTGIGSGLILNHAPYSGEHGMAMEFGHLCIEHHDGRLCGCGNHGCVEAYASATAIIRRFNECCGAHSDAKEVFELAQQGHDCANRIMLEAGQYLGMAIAEAVKLLDVTSITVSGGLSGAWDLLYPALMSELDTNLIPPLKGKVDVLRSTLDDNAGLLGAAAIAP
ncbi:glucokinase [Mariprofundus micogutta]|uniref:Glucokinase n=1 Tax=Mariprofundus micogutta TaxID=1921010 RepID=A0A1L8CJN6_9PROT|nr:ROK family protein [Mariprofundus micogutta]GAV19134.1 glucokinase [Mariprofundus micogutta]